MMINHTELNLEEYLESSFQRIPKWNFHFNIFNVFICFVLGFGDIYVTLVITKDNDYFFAFIVLLLAILNIPLSSKKILGWLLERRFNKRETNIVNSVEFYEDGFMITSNQTREFVDNLFQF